MMEALPTKAVWKSWGNRASWILKLGSTVLLLFLAFRKVPLHDLAGAWTRLHSGWAIAAVLAYLPLSVGAESVRLWAAGRRVASPYLHLYEWSAAFLESRPWFYLLPASAGADAVIWYRLRKCGWSHGECGFTVISVRLWGLALWALIAGLTLALVPESRTILSGIPRWGSSWPLWLGGGCLALITCVIAPHWLAQKQHIGLRNLPFTDPLVHLLLAIISAFVTGGCVWMAAWAAGLPFSLPACLGLLAWLNFAMALPISLGGLGLQEALVLRLGLPMGLPAATLLAFSAIVHLMRATLALAGGLAIFLNKEGTTPDPVP